jgi:hypothetical protein
MIYPYVDNELHIITPCVSSKESHKENPGYFKYRNNMTNYIMIMRISLFNNILKCYIDYLDAFEFMVGNLMVTYHPTGHKGDSSMNDKV